MFETGMSALVLKICSEYAKALGLNFPPCVQQEINAIAQYVDLHTVKDLKVEQNGNVVTITCFTEDEQEKIFAVTLPEPEVNVDVLFNLIKGSSSVVVDKSEDGTYLVVRLDKSQEVQYVQAYGGRPLTTDQLNILKANKNNQIMYYGGSKYYFKLAEEKSSDEWIYATITETIYRLTVNMTTGSVTLSNLDRRYYKHLLKGTANAYLVSGSSVKSPVEYEMTFITDSSDSMKVDGSTAQNDKLGEYAGCYITAYGTISLKTSDEGPCSNYPFEPCGFKHEGSPGIYSVNYLYLYDPRSYGQPAELEKVAAQIATVDSDTVTEL